LVAAPNRVDWVTGLVARLRAPCWAVAGMVVSLGAVAAPDATACDFKPSKPEDVPPPAPAVATAPRLSQRQLAVINEFVANPAITVDNLAERLKAAGPFTDRQADALRDFFAKTPTAAEQKLSLCVKLLRAGTLTREQRDFLLDDYREQYRWRRSVGRLFAEAHVDAANAAAAAGPAPATPAAATPKPDERPSLTLGEIAAEEARKAEEAKKAAGEPQTEPQPAPAPQPAPSPSWLTRASMGSNAP